MVLSSNTELLNSPGVYVCFLLSWTGFPIPKLDLLSQLEGGEEQGAPSPQDVEGRGIPKATYTGEDLETLSRCHLYMSLAKVFLFFKGKAGCMQKVWKSGCAGLTGSSRL